MQTVKERLSVVKLITGRPVPVLAETEKFLDPVFQFPEGSSLDEKILASMKGVEDHLAHAVARTPDCLLAHVQRIVLHTKRGESERLQGALVDLFIVLGKRGAPLRKRMLNLAKPLVDPTLTDLLTAKFEQGISATEVLPDTSNSVLTKAITGTTEMVKQVDLVPGDGRDPLQDSRECLEFGQVEQAQRILEEAIVEDPERAELHHDLLDIYSHTADREGFYTMRARVEPMNKALAQLWEKTAVRFTNVVNQ